MAEGTEEGKEESGGVHCSSMNAPIAVRFIITVPPAVRRGVSGVVARRDVGRPGARGAPRLVIHKVTLRVVCASEMARGLWSYAAILLPRARLVVCDASGHVLAISFACGAVLVTIFTTSIDKKVVGE